MCFDVIVRALEPVVTCCSYYPKHFTVGSAWVHSRFFDCFSPHFSEFLRICLPIPTGLVNYGSQNVVSFPELSLGQGALEIVFDFLQWVYWSPEALGAAGTAVFRVIFQRFCDTLRAMTSLGQKAASPPGALSLSHCSKRHLFSNPRKITISCAM